MTCAKNPAGVAAVARSDVTSATPIPFVFARTAMLVRRTAFVRGCVASACRPRQLFSVFVPVANAVDEAALSVVSPRALTVVQSPATGNFWK